MDLMVIPLPGKLPRHHGNLPGMQANAINVSPSSRNSLMDYISTPRKYAFSVKVAPIIRLPAVGLVGLN